MTEKDKLLKCIRIILISACSFIAVITIIMLILGLIVFFNAQNLPV